jgi:aminoglycoside 6'-N-acetyltransferase
MFQRSAISFNRLEQADLAQMYHWLRNPHVSRWYGPTPDTLAEVEGKYVTRISGEEPVDCFIVRYEKRPVAYIQTYRIDHDIAYAEALGVDRDAAGIDLFIGEDSFRYHGFGPIILQEFIKRIVFTSASISCCVIAPTVSNDAAIRAYQKAGFRHVKTVPVPSEPEPEYVMILWPDEIDDCIHVLDEDGSQ